MEIEGLMLDPTSNVPIVILRDEQSHLFLPIWIGVFEANAIALRIEGVEPPRPMTHDLLRLHVEQLGARVEKIVICDLQEAPSSPSSTSQHDGRERRPSTPVRATRSRWRCAPTRRSASLRDVLDKAQAAELATRRPTRSGSEVARGDQPRRPRQVHDVAVSNLRVSSI